MVPNFLQDDALRLLFFGGKGGVGKTTCAASTALYLARKHPSRSFLLVSTDPAHSLLDCFADFPIPGNLTLNEIDPLECLVRFRSRHDGHLSTIALRGTFLDETDIAQLLDLSMPGLDEMMALLEIVAWLKQDRYACIVVDTAPAGHTLKLVELPALMRRWVSALDAMLAKYRYMARLYRGTYRKESVDLFLEEILADLKNLRALLRSPKSCRFVPVMMAESLSLHVTRMMVCELERIGLPMQEMIVNRMASPQSDCPICTESASRQRLVLDELALLFPMYAFWGLPMFLDEVRGEAPLSSVWNCVRPLAQANWSAEALPHRDSIKERTIPPHQSPVSNPPPLPAPSTKLLLFAGKGGVGKTTLACASALRMAQERCGIEILLFSVDPAHSLAACLGCEIGSEETRVAPGLSVIELNTQGEYERLKQDYATEVLEVFGLASGHSNVDLAFDREVMERMMDIVPPGLDEMLAIARIVNLMEHDRYDLFVLDTAPTGHLIRFLEMPELTEKWLKTFFSLFLKYRELFWLPKTSQMMVELSKKLKALRRMLIDPSQSALVAVTIPTEMAFAETQDLFAACGRLGVALPILFVNMITPPSTCLTCSALRRAQEPVLRRYQSMYADQNLASVFRQKEPRGFERLGELGRTLYTTSRQPTRYTNQGEMQCQI